MKFNFILKCFCISLLSASASNAIWFKSNSNPTVPSYLTDSDIATLKSDFDKLSSGHQTIQEIKTAQQIIDLIRNDSEGQKHATNWQNILKKFDVAHFSTMHDHPQEIQKQIQDSVNQSKEHIQSIAHKLKNSMAAGVAKLPMQQALDTVLSTVTSLEERMQQEQNNRLALEARTKKAEDMLAQRDNSIENLKQEVGILRTTIESTSSYYQTKLDNSTAMLQRTKSELEQTTKELLKTEEFAHNTQEYTKKIELVMQEKVQEKENHIQQLQVQLAALDSQVNSLAQELGIQKQKIEEKEAIIGNEWPALQTLMKFDKKQQ